MQQQYFKALSFFQQRYGTKTALLMQVGNFFELYLAKIDNQDFGADFEISEILDLKVTCKDNRYEHSLDNPYMMGFPLISLERNLNKLLEACWTVIVVEQSDHAIDEHNELNTILNPSGKNTIMRRVTGIYSPGTSIDFQPDVLGNYLISIYFQDEGTSRHCGRQLLTVGMSAIDIGTGKSIIYEVAGSHEDPDYVFTETYRFLATYPAREVIISSTNLAETRNLEQRLGLTNGQVNLVTRYLNNLPEQYQRLSYQENLLDQVFGVNSINNLAINRHQSLLVALCLLLQFVYEHNEKLLKELAKPYFWLPEDHLILANNCIEQLELVSSKNREALRNRGPQKIISSVLSLLDMTATAMGRRLLKERLLNPIIDVQRLNQRYLYIERLTQDQLAKEFHEILKLVPDFEKLHRRIRLAIIDPCQFNLLDEGYHALLDLLARIKSDATLSQLVPPELDDLNAYIEAYQSVLDLNQTKRFVLNSINDSFFKPGNFLEIDQLSNQIKKAQNLLEEIAEQLSSLIKTNSNHKQPAVKLKINSDGDYFLNLTLNRYQTLKNVFKTPVKLSDGQALRLSMLKIYKENRVAKNCDLTCDLVMSLSNDLNQAQTQLKQKIPQIYKQFLSDLCARWRHILAPISRLVAQLDLYQSSARVALYYHYTRPEAVDSESSFLEAESLRHPIVEQIDANHTYVPHDIILTSQPKNPAQIEHQGFLIYGINGAGKTLCMKSVGLAIIMAQAGFWVAAQRFRFSPYRVLMTRILGNDNLFQGQSTFTVEMNELKAIIERVKLAGKQSLVLGDEICHGTESVSGTGLVVSTIEFLIKHEAQFIFASHLHQVVEFIEELKPKLGIYHLKVTQAATGGLIYDRRLTSGQGDTNYGIEVADLLGLEKTLIVRAHQVRRQLQGLSDELQPDQVSRYNQRLLKPSKCQECQINPAVDTHHIQPQRAADCLGFINHTHKNVPANLIWLCKDCHKRKD